MKKRIFLISFVLFLVFTTSYFTIVSAREDNSGNDHDNDFGRDNQYSDDGFNDNSGSGNANDDSVDDQIRDRQQVDIENSLGKLYRVRVESEEIGGEIRQKIRTTERYEAGTKLEVEAEGNEIKVRLANGQTKTVRVLPNEAVSAAAQEIGQEDVDIELEEEDGNVYYKVQGEKDGKFLGLFRSRVRVETKVNAETGEVQERQKSWWAFLVSGEDNDQFGTEKVVVCHATDEGRQSLQVDGSALRAHLAHGDVLGECLTE